VSGSRVPKGYVLFPLQLPVVKSACAELIQETVNEETVPGSLELADRCAPVSTNWMPSYSGVVARGKPLPSGVCCL
jgi:hypothetical protein